MILFSSFSVMRTKFKGSSPPLSVVLVVVCFGFLQLYGFVVVSWFWSCFDFLVIIST